MKNYTEAIKKMNDFEPICDSRFKSVLNDGKFFNIYHFDVNPAIISKVIDNKTIEVIKLDFIKHENSEGNIEDIICWPEDIITYTFIKKSNGNWINRDSKRVTKNTKNVKIHEGVISKFPIHFYSWELCL